MGPKWSQTVYIKTLFSRTPKMSSYISSLKRVKNIYHIYVTCEQHTFPIDNPIWWMLSKE